MKYILILLLFFGFVLKTFAGVLLTANTAGIVFAIRRMKHLA